jgi:hypothetical protein
MTVFALRKRACSALKPSSDKEPAMEKFIPCRSGIDIGKGFNTLTGEARGVAVGGEISEASTPGQTVKSDSRIVESQEQMNEALDVSVAVSGHYGLFSAEGRFGLSQQSSYTSQSTYVVARCTVENAFRSFARPALLPEAGERLRSGGPDAFKEGFGDSFVQGLRGGGELYAVFQLTSSSSDEQKSIAASLSASVQGLFAGGSLDTSVSSMKNTSSKLSSMSVLFYQRAGTDNSIAPVGSPEEIMKRLKDFPTIARAAPVGYIAQLIDYQVLALPQFDAVGYQQRLEALQDYAQLKMKYLGIRSEIDLVRRNPILFLEEPAHTDGALAKAYDLYTNAVNMLNRHGRKVANKEIEPTLFDPGAYDPSLRELPIFFFKKKAPPEDQVAVPNVAGQPVASAQAAIKAAGLNPTSNAVSVPKEANAILNIITKQAPLPGTEIPKGSSVVLEYNYVPSDRFKWQAIRVQPTAAASRMYAVNR